MQSSGNSLFPRRAGIQLTLILLTIALGLASRWRSSSLPVFVAKYAGDTLWATAVFFGLGLIWPAAPARRLALGAAVVALAVELSQLAHPAWLDAFRNLPGVGLVIGYDFVASDLVCYAAGIALAVLVDAATHELPQRRRVR